MKLVRCATLGAALSLVVGPALAEGLAAAAAAAPPRPRATIAAADSAPIAPVVMVVVPEGAELPMRLEESLSSKHAHEGDRFTVALAQDVKLPGGAVLKAGYRGAGEVIEARDNGMLGRTGKLGVRLSYLRVGDQPIKLRATRYAQGAHNRAVQVGALLLLFPAAPFIKGKDTEIPKGTVLNAFVDQDTALQAPLPPPPTL